LGAQQEEAQADEADHVLGCGFVQMVGWVFLLGCCFIFLMEIK
jgi:hypothetical protein